MPDDSHVSGHALAGVPAVAEIQEVVGFLLALQAGIQRGGDLFQTFLERTLGALGDFITHEEADRIDLLPFVFECKQGTVFKVSRGDVDGLRKLAPIRQVVADLRFAVAVIVDQEFGAGFKSFAHWFLTVARVVEDAAEFTAVGFDLIEAERCVPCG